MIFRRLRESLARTRQKLAGGLSRLFGRKRDLDDDFLSELEEVLYGADLGTTGLDVLKTLRTEYQEKKLRTTEEVRARLRSLLRASLGEVPAALCRAESGPTVVLIVGVNGKATANVTS